MILLLSDTRTRMYCGEADKMQVEFSATSDYEQFINAKSSSIIIYNDKIELESIPNIIYISGYLKLPIDFPVSVGLEGYEYKLELITKDGKSRTTTPMMYEESIDNGIRNFPFIAYGRKHDVFNKVMFKISETEIYPINVEELK